MEPAPLRSILRVGAAAVPIKMEGWAEVPGMEAPEAEEDAGCILTIQRRLMVDLGQSPAAEAAAVPHSTQTQGESARREGSL